MSKTESSSKAPDQSNEIVIWIHNDWPSDQNNPVEDLLTPEKVKRIKKSPILVDIEAEKSAIKERTRKAEAEEIVNQIARLKEQFKADWLFQQWESELKNNKIKAAIKSFRDIIDKYPESDKAPISCIRLGEIYVSANEFSKASAILQKFVDSNKKQSIENLWIFLILAEALSSQFDSNDFWTKVFIEDAIWYYNRLLKTSASPEIKEEALNKLIKCEEWLAETLYNKYSSYHSWTSHYVSEAIIHLNNLLKTSASPEIKERITNKSLEYMEWLAKIDFNYAIFQAKHGKPYSALCRLKLMRVDFAGNPNVMREIEEKAVVYTKLLSEEFEEIKKSVLIKLNKQLSELIDKKPKLEKQLLKLEDSVVKQTPSNLKAHEEKIVHLRKLIEYNIGDTALVNEKIATVSSKTFDPNFDPKTLKLEEKTNNFW